MQLKFLWFAASVVHVVGTINCRAHVNSMFWVLVTGAVLDMELGLFLVFAVLRMRVDAFALKFLLDDFAFDESFGLFEIIHRANDFGVSGYDIGTNVSMLSPDSILNPDRTVLIVGCLVKVVLGTGRKYTAFCIIHSYVNFINEKNRFLLILFDCF